MPTVIGTRRRSKSVAEDVPQLTSPVGIHPGPIRTSSPSNISASDVTSAESDNDDSDEDGIPRKNPSSPASPRLEHEAVVPDLSSPPPASWADIDPSVLLALSAPVGSWLTGGDHVKNLFLVLLLIVYLHQLITVPWELYLKARSRRPHPLYQPPSNDDSGGELSRIRQLARSELRQLELIYLLLTVVTPFVGASVLQYTLQSLGGVDTLSWFSTTLFVLATGVRPWSHLIHRLRSRTEDLHSTVHYPPHESQAVSDSKLKALLERVKSLETELAKVKRNMATETRVQDVYDDLGSSLDIIERTIQKNERRVDAMRSALDTRVNTVEKTVARALGKHRSTTHISTSLPPYALPQAASHPHTAHIFSGIIRILYVLWSFATLSFIIKPVPNEFSPTSPSRRMHRNGRLPPHRMKSPPAQLETIQEDSQELQNGGLGSSDSDSDSFDPGSPSTAQDRDTLADPSSSADLAANIVTIPYRLSVKLLAALSPPVQRLWG